MKNLIYSLLLGMSLSCSKINVAHSILVRGHIAAFSSIVQTSCSGSGQRCHFPRHSTVPLLIVIGNCNMRHNPSDLHSSQTCYVLSRFRSSPKLYLSIDDDQLLSSAKNMTTTVNIQLLKKEITRLTLRTHKKIDKASTRIRGAEEQYNKLRLAIDACPSDEGVDEKLLQQLEQAPNLDLYQQELHSLQDRLQKLNWLADKLNTSPLKSKKELSLNELEKIVPDDGAKIVQYILDLEIRDDYENHKQKKIEIDANNRRAKSEKSNEVKELNSQKQKQGGRLPYRRYYSEQQTEIRVGKQATDNDMLSLSPEHRSGSHWWYHASGCSGSHVVLCTDASNPIEDDILDAASLAALKSKCISQSVIKVSMTRARNVSKPPGAKPGLVQLNGDIRTITLRKSEVEKRCDRLEKTVVVN